MMPINKQINKQSVRKVLGSVSLGAIAAGVTLLSGQATALAQSCNVFGCSAPGAGSCNVFGCPAPGAGSCDVFGCPPAPPAPAPTREELRSFSISNSTGRTIERLYFSPSSNTEWGPDDLGNGVLHSGDAVSFDLRGPSCLFDILAVLSNGREIEKRQVNTCDFNRFTIQ